MTEEAPENVVRPRKKSAPREISEKEISDAVAKAKRNLNPRMQALNDYSAHLADSDARVSKFIEDVIKQTHWTYEVSVWIYIFSYVTALGSFIFGLLLFFQNQLFFALLCVVGGLIILFFLINRNPLKNVRYLVNNMVKLNILYVGYARQIHQVDASFKNMLSKTEGIDNINMEEMLGHIQMVIDETLTAISHLTNEMEE